MPSPRDYTVGVEEEYQLLDGETGELRSRAHWVIGGDWAGVVKPEMQLHTVEVETQVCEATACLGDDLARLRLTAMVAAEAHGLRIAAAGTHPCAGADHGFSEGETYRRIRDRYAFLADDQNIFGMHVHVGVPDGVDRVRVMNAVRAHLPLLVALTASSPFHEGRDTGYASFRSVLWRRWPRSGLPPRLRDEAEMAELTRWLTDTGTMDGPGRIYWDLRPHHVYPTLEFRAMDVTPRRADALAAATLARALVAGAVEGRVTEPPHPGPVADALAAENAWRAARWGTDAVLVDLESPTPAEAPLKALATRLAARLAPVAAALGDDDLPAQVEEALARGSAAFALRERAAAGGALAEAARWAAAETVLGAGLDRRRAQRTDDTP